MRISILLPYKENFTPIYAGAVSLFVKDTTKLSKFKENIIVYGNTNLKNIYKLHYKNIFLKKNLIQSGSKVYVNEFLKHEFKNPSDIIEIHNRPNYFHLIFDKAKNQKIVLYFHNDPLTMTGSRSKTDRIKILNNATKIIFNSHWSKKRFLENITGFHINSEKINVIYQSTTQIKIDLSKKKKWITFVGKLNRAKGYDLFGKAIIKILKKYNDWRAIVIGDEPRMTLNFKHKRLNNMGFQNHDRVLKIFEKTSIAVACSRWDEPLGRTSLEATSRGCATIISNKGGLPETITNGIILRELNVESVYSAIKDLIENAKKRREIQKLSMNNFFHTNALSTKKIDAYREEHTRSSFDPNTFNLNKQKTMRVLHVTNFNERHDGRLFFNTGRRLNNGFIRLGHSVLEFSDRDIVKHYKGVRDYSGAGALNRKLINTVYNYKPDLLIFGHADLIKGRYTADINFALQTHAYFVRSPHARAKITKVDVSKASKAPGVVTILTGEDLAKDKIGGLIAGWKIVSQDGKDMKIPPHPALAKDSVNFVGDHVAVVIAETLEQAKNAAEQVNVGYKIQKAVINAADATSFENIHEGIDNNLCFDFLLGDKGKTDEAFSKADKVVKLDLVNNRLIPNAIEPRAAIGDYNPSSEQLTLYTASQNPHLDRLILSAFNAVHPEHKFRVVAPDVGGGFGSKINAYAEDVVVAWASKKVERPVKWVAERSESFFV